MANNFDEARTRDQRQRDLDFANSFRLESIKHLISISSGIFVFTVVFLKDFLQVSPNAARGPILIKLGWLLLVVSIVAGVWNMRYWAWYFSSWAREPEVDSAVKWRQSLDSRRKLADRAQVLSFALGLLLISAFALLNF